MKRDPDAGRHGGRRKGTTEDEMVGITDAVDLSLSKLWEMVKDRGSLACFSPWGHKESDMTD